MTVHKGRSYDQISVGDVFTDSITVTETHLVMAAGMFGDFNPLHVDQAFAQRSRFGGRILHGVFTGALVGSVAGMVFAGTAIAFLEHNCRFTAPVRAGDTLTTTWTMTGKVDKPMAAGGIVEMVARCVNQHGVTVLEATGKMLVRNA